ncbi:MAG: hypothetical protein EXR39_06555 [Betaproteobacteria bacterium]|nr:hypothetical protein [Betaproteobacteria bacterium]
MINLILTVGGGRRNHASDRSGSCDCRLFCRWRSCAGFGVRCTAVNGARFRHWSSRIPRGGPRGAAFCQRLPNCCRARSHRCTDRYWRQHPTRYVRGPHGPLALSRYSDSRATLSIPWDMGHGTAVASMVLSQSGGAGDELGARVLSIRVFNGPTASQQNLADGLRYSVGRAPIVNMSLSAPGPIAQAALMESVGAGQLVVVAAGNSALANPEWPARFAKDEWAGAASSRLARSAQTMR